MNKRESERENKAICLKDNDSPNILGNLNHEWISAVEEGIYVMLYNA